MTNTEGEFIVRQWDMFDGWIDISGALTHTEAQTIWDKCTCNGQKNICYSDGDYYRIFPFNTKMLVTPEYLGR